MVSSFGSLDLDPRRLNSEGPQMLGCYLAYTESGGHDLGPNVKRRPLVPQYGVSGYWIDFAAQHPTQPGRMVLAIEADGASYHSSVTARDRDRLRQQQLENQGWVFHRIWSTEWFHRHEMEVERAKEAYRRAVERADGPPERIGMALPGPGAMALSDAPPAIAPAPQRSGPQPVEGGRGSISKYSHAELVRLILWIQSDTLLRTEDQLITEAMNCLDLHRRGSVIVTSLTAAIERAKQPGPPQEDPPPPPRRSTSSRQSYRRQSRSRRRLW